MEKQKMYAKIGLSLFMLCFLLSGCTHTKAVTAEEVPEISQMPCRESTNLYIRWAKKKMSVEEAENENMIQDERLGPDPVAFGFIYDEWEALKSKIKEGDELWYFSSPPETWDNLAGRSGYVLLRSCEVVAVIVNMMN